MKRYLTIPLIGLLLAGCTTHMEPGQAFICETRTLGVDLSIPVPFADGVNIANIRIGWIENKIYSGNSVKLKSNSTHQDLSLLTGSGSIIRYFEVGYDEPSK
jgi:hypothetical protein